MIVVKIKKSLIGVNGKFDLDVEFKVEKGEFLAIFGRSGSGKTTILRSIAGLETPDEGYIKFNDVVYFDSKKKVNLPPQRRNIGFVFQSYALFPNMTVYQNLLFANKNKQKVEEMLETVELKELKDRYPHHLSGGQQQRVALARAIIRNPDILLLDEPLSALDHQTRLKLQNEIKSIQRKLGITTILVSHDKSEVFRLADRVILLEEGKIKKTGTPREVFLEKNISGKFSFIGEVIDIKSDGVIRIVTIDINGDLVEVVATEDVDIGEKVLVGVKGFSPVIKRIQG